jgi:hypothetical protein
MMKKTRRNIIIDFVDVTFGDVDHGAGRLGVGRGASVVARVLIGDVAYRQLTSDTSICRRCCTFGWLLLAIVRH